MTAVDTFGLDSTAYITLASISCTATGLTYNNTTGSFSLTSGYVIPTTTEESNWNTAYGWGNHASAGYFVGTDTTIRALMSSTATGLTYTALTGVFSLAAGYVIPTTTQETNWGTAYTDTNGATELATANKIAKRDASGYAYFTRVGPAADNYISEDVSHNMVFTDAVTGSKTLAQLGTGSVTNGDSHDHSGGDGAQINHTTLSNIGTNTHAQVDTHIAAANPHSGSASLALDNLTSVAINTSLVSDTDNTDDLGTSIKEWKDVYIDGVGYIDTVQTDTIQEDSVGVGVTIDGVTLKDGGALDITGGTNTFNLTNGTAVIDIAASSTLDVNASLTVEAASAINQDVTSDASPTFAAVNGVTIDGDGLQSVSIGPSLTPPSVTPSGACTLVGAATGIGLTTGQYVTGLGAYAGDGITSGHYSTAIGSYALRVADVNCIGLGYSAGRYETGSGAFYVDAFNRTNTAGDKAGAILYGVMSATPSSQTLVANALFSATYGAKFDHIDELTAAHGVSIDGVLLKDSGITLINAIDEFSTDGTLAGNSDVAVPTEKAVKTYVDGKSAATSTDNAIARFDGTTGDTQNSSVTIDDSGVISGSAVAGTYAPSFTNISGCDSFTGYDAYWFRLGNIVTVHGSVGVNYTTAGSESYFDITVPINSAITGQDDANGVISSGKGTGGSFYGGDAGANKVRVVVMPATNANELHGFEFTYLIN
jgi:hypothetical protein